MTHLPNVAPRPAPPGAVGGGRESGGVILHADADAFFASVEQRDDPRLRGRPMVVAHEVVACPSYEARALGIHAGMPLRQVKRRWPEVLVTEYRSEAYEEASALLFDLFRRFTPLVEPGSMEEAFLDVTGRDPADVGLVDLLNMSFDTMSALISRYRMASNPPDVLVTVPSNAVRTLDFHRAAEMIELGRQLTTEALDHARY